MNDDNLFRMFILAIVLLLGALIAVKFTGRSETMKNTPNYFRDFDRSDKRVQDAMRFKRIVFGKN